MYYNNYSSKTLDGEYWLPVIGYEGIYEVSNFGRVKRLVGKSCISERILKQNATTRSGKRVACQVRLCVNNIKSGLLVHRLVGYAFIENPNGYPQILHEDDDPFNNVVENLRWGTQKQNIQDCHKRGRAANNLPKLFGVNHPHYGKEMSYESKKKMSDTKKKITDQQIDMAKSLVASGVSQRQAAKKAGLSETYLCQLIHGYKRL